MTRTQRQPCVPRVDEELAERVARFVLPVAMQVELALHRPVTAAKLRQHVGAQAAAQECLLALGSCPTSHASVAVRRRTSRSQRIAPRRPGAGAESAPAAAAHGGAGAGASGSRRRSPARDRRRPLGPRDLRRLAFRRTADPGERRGQPPVATPSRSRAGASASFFTRRLAAIGVSGPFRRGLSLQGGQGVRIPDIPRRRAPPCSRCRRWLRPAGRRGRPRRRRRTPRGCWSPCVAFGPRPDLDVAVGHRELAFEDAGVRRVPDRDEDSRDRRVLRRAVSRRP